MANQKITGDLTVEGSVWTTPTVVSVSKGDNVYGEVRCFRIGGLVILEFSDFGATTNVATNEGVLITGIPTSNGKAERVFSIPSGHPLVRPLRMHLNGNNVETHYTDTNSLGANSNAAGHAGIYIYFTDDDL